jgi:DNA-directed RNA polymerase subunit alpha
LSQFVFPTIECTENSSTYGCFVTAEPHLPKGFGIVVGNSLRRMLLSSLMGTAVTWVKIEGVQHEFSTIPHTKEDVIELLLNIKSLRLRATGDGWPKKMILDVKGAGVILADKIKPSDGLEIMNPDLYLVTLDSDDAHLSMELNVEQGMGYKVATRTDNLTTGTIPVDAIFTPVRRANYKVEPAGVSLDRDKLTIEIWTDGTIAPTEALPQSGEILVECFRQFTNLAAVPQLPEGIQKVAQASDYYNTKVDSIGLPPRVVRALARNHISSVGELLEKSDEDLLDLPKFGRKSLEEVKKALVAGGFVDVESAGLDKLSSQKGDDGSEEESNEA